MTTPEEKMSAARAQVVFKEPYFAAAVHGFVYQAAPGIRTMLVTKKLILGYDPEWAARAPVSKLAADIVHEVHHFVRRHFERAEFMADSELFNIAADLAINPDLKAAGWDLDSSAIFPEDFGLPEGKTTEEYYDLLRQMKQEGKLGQNNTPTGGGKKNKQGSPGQGPPGQQGSPGEGGSGDAPEERGICAGKCGGVAGHSDTKDIEDELDAEPGLGRSPQEVLAIEKRVLADIKQHVEAKGRGNLPGDILEQIKKLEEESFVRWQDEMQAVLYDTTGRMQAGGDDFSLSRPSKRSIMYGAPRPSLVEYLPEVAFIRDSSGSMGDKQLNDALREAYAIVQTLGIDEVWFTDADTRISIDWKRVGPEFFKNLTEVHGRNGTSFIEPIEEAQKLTPYPDILVYLTDGDGAAPENPPPNMSVVWCVVPGHYNRAPAKWGHTVIISDDPKTRNAPIRMPDDDDDDDDDAAVDDAYDDDALGIDDV